MRIHQKINKNPIIIGSIILIISLILVSVAIYLNLNNKPAENKVTENSQATTTQVVEAEKPKVVKIAMMGDMLAHDTIIQNAKTSSGYDFTKYFANIKPAYSDADVIFCNQEGLSSGESYVISGYPSFNAPTSYAGDLHSGAGCNVINLANNHMGDKGVNATNATIDVWSNIDKLAIAGANKSAQDQNKVAYFEKNGIKFAFLAFADFNNNKATPSYSINIYHDKALLEKLVSEARQNSDVVLVSMHWGTEDQAAVNQDQIDQVSELAKLGVDVIVGTGPHVLQKFDIVDRADGKKMYVWYSIGNMLSSQLRIDELIGGIAKFEVQKDSSNVITINNLSFTPTYMHYEWTAAESANSDLLARKNAMIYLLSNSADPLSRSLFNTSVAEQKQYVIKTLGSKIEVK